MLTTIFIIVLISYIIWKLIEYKKAIKELNQSIDRNKKRPSIDDTLPKLKPIPTKTNKSSDTKTTSTNSTRGSDFTSGAITGALVDSLINSSSSSRYSSSSDSSSSSSSDNSYSSSSSDSWGSSSGGGDSGSYD